MSNLLVATQAVPSGSNLLTVCIVLAIVGALQDYGSAIWTKWSVSGQNVKASILSIVSTFVSYLVWFKLGEHFLSGDILPLLVYSCAGGVGTFVGLKHGDKKVKV